jgi:Ca2+/Na+ antiporter
MSTSFWIEDPCILFSDFEIFPKKDMSLSEKMNALTRLVVIVTIIMYFLKFKYWLVFGALSILLVVVFYSMKKRQMSNYSGSSVDETDEQENFTLTPTYVGDDFTQTVVSPTFSEEWQVPPPAYDLYTEVPLPDEDIRFEEPLRPQSYPYGQYLTKTNLLPSDEYYTHTGCGGTQNAREYANSAFLRHDLAHRDNMMRIFKKKLNRRFRHNTNDVFSPYMSY